MANLTHFDESGRPRMVDVSAKPATARLARASVLVKMKPATRRALVIHYSAGMLASVVAEL